MDRRSFFYAAGAVSAAFSDGAVERVQAAAGQTPSAAAEAAKDEDFWFEVRHAFTVDRSIINLNNGGVSPAPRVAQQAMNRYLDMQNMAPVHYMWKQLDPQVETVRQQLADDFGCDPEAIGTHPAANRLAIAESMTFHQSIGAERKAARLRYLRERWARRLEQLPGARVLTSYDPAMSCAIGLLAIDGVDPGELTQELWTGSRILVVPIRLPGEYEGIRITPNVYTTLQEIDSFCEAVERKVKQA